MHDYIDADERRIMISAIDRLEQRVASRDRKYNQRYDMVVENKSLKDVRINASKKHTKGGALRRKRRHSVS